MQLSEWQPIMRQLLEAFADLHRLSGSEDAERSVDVLCLLLEQQGIPCKRESCRLWLSDPLTASLSLPAFPDIRFQAKTRSFSAHCPQGCEAELFYDSQAMSFVTDNAFADWSASVRGKLVIADQGFEDYVQRLMRAGAAGLIHVWGSPETALHEETVGPIWGSPVPEDTLRYPRLPVISINQQQGNALLALLQQRSLRARITTEVREHVATCSLPVVEIPGNSDEFVLLSSHYDSWHQGLTDNATGNALCLAMALAFARHPQPLQRGLRIAWWPGHSNARYGGSAWYADSHRAELLHHAVAHINVDSPGCLGGDQLMINVSGAESRIWLNQALQAVTGNEANRITPLGKGADQSFWGVGIPLHFALRETQTVRSTLSPGSGGGWWWHTEEDTLDKVDEENLLRDARIHYLWLQQLLTEERLPLDVHQYLQQMIDELTQLQSIIDPAFSLKPWVTLLGELKQACQSASPHHLHTAVGLWHRLRYRAADDYHPDLSYHNGAFPGMQLLSGHHRHTCSDHYWLMLETQYLRQLARGMELLQQSLKVLQS